MTAGDCDQWKNILEIKICVANLWIHGTAGANVAKSCRPKQLISIQPCHTEPQYYKIKILSLTQHTPNTTLDHQWFYYGRFLLVKNTASLAKKSYQDLLLSLQTKDSKYWSWPPSIMALLSCICITVWFRCCPAVHCKCSRKDHWCSFMTYTY